MRYFELFDAYIYQDSAGHLVLADMFGTTVLDRRDAARLKSAQIAPEGRQK